MELSQQKKKAKSEQDRQLKKLQDKLTKTEVGRGVFFAGCTVVLTCGFTEIQRGSEVQASSNGERIRGKITLTSCVHCLYFIFFPYAM